MRSSLWIPLLVAAIALVGFASSARQNPHQKNIKFAVVKSDAEWRKALPTASYQVLRHAGTEAPFSSSLDLNFKPGTYYCAGCGQELFTSDTKFDSHTGWPSFFKPYKKDAVIELPDDSFGERRTEVICSRCGGHLGHVFDDGPPPTGLRYCMNGVALVFKPKK